MFVSYILDVSLSNMTDLTIPIKQLIFKFTDGQT